MARLRVFGILALLLTCGRLSAAQDLTGDWQGAIGTAPRQLRLIVHIDKGDGAAWKATLASIDQSPDWGAAMPVDALTVQDGSVKFTVGAVRGSYEGTIAADGNSIVGTWRQLQPSPLTLVRATPATAWKDPSSHTTRFVNVERDVKLEVLDWGGPATGQTLVLLAGLGNTAHVYDVVAPKLAANYHVIGVTRRGFGASSVPAAGYGADRLGDDVLAVLDALAIRKPIVVGHSLGGEELSSIGSRQPARVAGLIYLDAGYSYAFHAPDIEPFPGAPPPSPTPLPPVIEAIMTGVQKYTKVPVPILAIFAVPADPSAAADEARRAEAVARSGKMAAQVKAFESGLPSARVVRIPNANHYVFLSNEADVLREMNTFIAGLK
jgi:non-heme chloroperoxidase